MAPKNNYKHRKIYYLIDYFEESSVVTNDQQVIPSISFSTIRNSDLLKIHINENLYYQKVSMIVWKIQ